MTFLYKTMNIINLEKVNSTNFYAKLNLDNISDKTVVCAEAQTSGKGRFNRRWVDMGKGNLFMSLVLKPSDVFSPVYSNLTQYTSVILCRIFEEYGINPEIKWPNDILINGKKIAGILSESVICGSALKGLILGVGVNLNADNTKLALVSDKMVTALNIELLHEYEDKQLFLEKFLREFFKDYEKFLNSGFYCIKAEYLERCNFLGKIVRVNLLNKTLEGKALRLSDSGELVLNAANKLLVLSSGDIL